MYQILNGKKVEASGDTVQEALWELKRNRPDDLIYPTVDTTGVHVRTGEDHMTVIEMVIADTETGPVLKEQLETEADIEEAFDQ